MAKRHPTARKATPRTTAAPDDIFIEKTLVISTWAQRNRQALILIGIALAAVVMGVLYYMNYRQGHLQRAALELERVEQGVAFGDTTTAKVELQQYIETFGNTPYAHEARLLLGALYLQSNQPAQAAEVLADGANVSRPLGLQVTTLLAKARAQQGQLDEAERLLLRVADRAELEFEVHEALEEAARLRKRSGNLAGAAALYQRILDDLEANAPERGLYEMRLAEITVQIENG